VWYEQRSSFAPDQVGVPLVERANRGFKLLQGPSSFSGKILGGCIDSMYDMFCPDCHADMPELCRDYQLFPSANDWAGRILLIESSEEKPSPDLYRRALEYLRNAGVFDAVAGVLVGKPMDEVYAAEYKDALVSVIDDPALAIVCNVNVGHALPRAIIPFGVEAYVDATEQVIRFPSA
jgi:muramoyltetrapeptide carboxypeptidase LdcA involved in peptidoglycan recycling